MQSDAAKTAILLTGPAGSGKTTIIKKVVAALDGVGVSALHDAFRSCTYVIIDEIGKMELLSESFREAVLVCVNGGKLVLGTIMSGPHPWADALKNHPRVRLMGVTQESRDSLPGVLLDKLTHSEASR